MALFDKQRVASQWETLEVSKLLSDGARNIEAGTATDAGRMWHLPTSHPDPIVLAGGIPDERVLPTTALVDAFSKALAENSADALMYGGWFGYEGCRKAIAERQNSLEGTSLQPSNIIMHNGSSGCLENVLRAFVQPRDVVIVESPSYSGTVRAIQGFQSDVVEIPMGPSGVDPDLFRQTVENLKGKGLRVKLFYTIPDYHNPTGTVTESNIRQSILETCASNEIIIAEDAAYTEIYFKGSAPPSSYYALSDGHGVIKMCSFSKIIATGLRCGWIQAREEFADPLTKVRFDMGSSPLVHYVLEDLIKSGKLDTHVDSMRILYEKKCKSLVNSLLEHCSPYVELSEPQGGYFLWVKSKTVRSDILVQSAAEEGLIFPTGSVFFVDKSLDKFHFRLAFTRATFEHLSKAGERLHNAFERALD